MNKRASIGSIRRSRRRLGVILAIGALLVLAAVVVAITVGPILKHDVERWGEVNCKLNLKKIGVALQRYYEQKKEYPRTRSGIRFLLAPIEAGILNPETTPIQKIVVTTYACPHDDYAMRVIDKAAENFRDLAKVPPEAISYAGRNTIDYPLDLKNPGQEVIASDAGGPDGRDFNHRRVINVLYLDCTIGEIDLTQLPDEVRENFCVGPDSPIEELRCLNKSH